MDEKNKQSYQQVSTEGAFVVFGVEDRMRRNYKVWEEEKGPDCVLEVASLNTWREDVERKPGIHAGLGVKEYFLYDPRGEYLTPRLQGYRLVDGEYERMSAVESIDRALTLPSEVLGLELRAKGGEMHFQDPATGQVLLSHAEEHSARRAAEIRAEEEAAARRAALRGSTMIGGRRSSRPVPVDERPNRADDPIRTVEVNVVSAAGNQLKRAVLHRSREFALKIEPRSVEANLAVVGVASRTARQHDDRRVGGPGNRADLPGAVPQRSQLGVDRSYRLARQGEALRQGLQALGQGARHQPEIRDDESPAGRRHRESHPRRFHPLELVLVGRVDEHEPRHRPTLLARSEQTDGEPPEGVPDQQVGRRNARMQEKPVQLLGDPVRMAGFGAALAPAVARAVVAARPGEPRDLGLNPDPVERGAAETRFENDGRRSSSGAVNVEPMEPDAHEHAGRGFSLGCDGRSAECESGQRDRGQARQRKPCGPPARGHLGSRDLPRGRHAGGPRASGCLEGAPLRRCRRFQSLLRAAIVRASLSAAAATWASQAGCAPLRIPTILRTHDGSDERD